MKLASLVSGGKDSIFAAYLASNEHEIKCLINIRPKRNDSWMFHIPNLHMVPLQAEAMELPLLTFDSSGEKEKELEDIRIALKKAIADYGIEGITTGALYSQYQKSRIDKICEELGLKSLAPLWNIDLEKYLGQLLENKFEVMIVGIAAQGFNEGMLGKTIDKAFIEELKKLHKKYQINIGGEGGEYESLVVNCPMFRKRLKILKAEKVMENENAGHLKIGEAVLE